ncbi:hypothetical protein AEAC466_14795 [Asticcacaulis sp. AC466]|uniref:TonB-dependent receptor n=1 Tax=Asticcacaulis sp. AC466 TaxID=1282362 RepID=UPI0003C3AE80|nr:TonB-dependent receptor [Asticcacaulis sp. AC466]ESQ83128.1 hypothetical protein AEAC466_14795 [Asticcacaulis sp. AC466]
MPKPNSASARTPHKACLYLGTALAASMLAATAATAQTQPEAAVPTADSHDTEVVVVTAQRRSQKLQDVPLAVTAISAQGLQNLQAQTIGDIQGVVPNLTLHEGDASNAVVYLRGIGQIDSLAFADPGVGIYVDDVYLGRAQGAFLDVYDVDHIEVLRGPQGTLYGRNTIGGAVKFVSKPFSSHFRAEAEATAGNYNDTEFRGNISGALNASGTLMGKAAIAYAKRDGYSDNAFDGRSDGDKNLLAGRLAVQWKPSEDFSLSLNLDNSRDHPDTSRTPARATDVFGYPATKSDPFQVDANFNTHNRLDTSGVSVVAAWHLSPQTDLKSVTAYRRMRYGAALDLDATPLDIFGVFDEEKQDQFSQELQFSYTGDRFNFVSGAYYFQEHDITYSGLYAPVITLVSGSLNDQTNYSTALYGQGTYKLTPRLSVTAGLRYTNEKKEFGRTQKFFAPSTTYPVDYSLPGALATDVSAKHTWDSLTPKLEVDYHFTDNQLAYVSVSKGFKSGGFDGRANDSAAGAIPYDPENLTAYEAGLKLSWPRQRITLNSAIFWNDYKDLQLSSFAADSSGGFIALFTNAGAATMRGVEIELNARPVPALTLSATVGYLDGHYDTYIGPNGADISDQRHLVNAPKWDTRGGATYRFDLGGNGSLTLIGDISYRSKAYTTVSSSEIVAQQAYTLVNAAVRWESPDAGYYVQLGAKNLTDRRYITQAFDLSDSLGYQLAYYGDPRTIRLSLGVKM